MRNKGLLVFLVAVLGVLNGCQTTTERIRLGALKSRKEINYYVNPDARPSILRVLVMPVRNQTEIPKAGDLIDQRLNLELSRVNYFELLTSQNIPPEEIKALTQSYFQKTSDFRDVLVRLGERHQIDAVLFPTLLQYHAYRPLTFGYKHSLIQTSSAEDVWSVDDLLDMAQPDVSSMAKSWYHKTHQDGDNPSLKADAMDVSIQLFTQFSLSLFIETWLK